MEAQIKHRLTVAEYLAFEAQSEIKHEYIDGVLYDMTGGTDKHSRIAANVIIALGIQLGSSDCRVYTSDMRVKVEAGRYVYPDLSVGCGRARHEDDGETSLLNPVAVVEVTSPTSMTRDHGLKRDLYQRMPSIQAYLIIDQREVRVDLHRRGEREWSLSTYRSLDAAVSLETLGCELPLAQIYRDIVIDD